MNLEEAKNHKRELTLIIAAELMSEGIAFEDRTALEAYKLILSETIRDAKDVNNIEFPKTEFAHLDDLLGI